VCVCVRVCLETVHGHLDSLDWIRLLGKKKKAEDGEEDFVILVRGFWVGFGLFVCIMNGGLIERGPEREMGVREENQSEWMDGWGSRS